ncbi:hypothetical protein MMC30_005845 [Trapelia coarctata]|nr:hypothetical protein [Trapelia coarctata]
MSKNSSTTNKGTVTNRRVQRARVSTGNFEAQSQSGGARRRSSRLSAGEATRTVSGETLVSGGDEIQIQLVQDIIQVLNLDWKVDSMPGDEIKESTAAAEGLKRRKSTRLEFLERASTIVEKTKSVLGKRGRDAMGASKQRLQYIGRRASLRPRNQEDTKPEGPPGKKVKIVEDTAVKQGPAVADVKRKPVARPKVKQWLSQGLYVGQERDFDPRLTERKNKAKRASTGSQNMQQRRALPLPMFAGQRILEMGRDFKLPFDVFSPLPPGQPKPEEWRKTQKNVFVGDAAEFWKKSKRLEHSTCICETSSGCEENCFNRFMFYECDDTNCNIGAEQCTNRSFEHLRQRCKAGGKYNIGVEVIKTADRGYGVRTNRTFEPNQIIVEYTGEIITQDECDNRMRTIYKDNECFYLMIFDQNMIIDATRGSIARFINHSCEPNCRMVKWTVAGKPRMALFAGEKGVMTGDELTYDYNFDPFSSKNIQECRCGAPSCRGVLGPKPTEKSSKPKDVKEALKPLVNIGTKRRLQQAFGDTVTTVTGKQRRLSMPLPNLPVKSSLNTIKRCASTYLTNAKVLGSSDATNARLVKKISERSLRKSRSTLSIKAADRKVKKQSNVTYQRRRSSNGTFILQKIDVEETIDRPEGPKMANASVRRNVVTTIRGARGTRGGKSIRVIGESDA